MKKSEILAAQNIENGGEVDFQVIPAELTETFDKLLDRLVEFENKTTHFNRPRGSYHALEAWLEFDTVAFNYTYQHCANCEEELNTFRFPIGILDADSLDEQLDILFIDMEAEIVEQKALKDHFEQVVKTRAEIKFMRQLAERYPEYLDVSKELPDLPKLPSDYETPYEEPGIGTLLLKKSRFGT